ncbi:MAG: hypothetical protein GY952_11995 [Rhodobacteraceae bacterium]|nr:hypothetical protein [Paracoccaceae bacterium]
MAKHEPGEYVSDSIVEAIHSEHPRTKTETLTVTFLVKQQLASSGWVNCEPFEVHVKIYLSDRMWSSGLAERQLDALRFNGDFDKPEFVAPEDGWWNLVCQHEPFEGRTVEKWTMAEWEQEAAPRPVSVEKSMAMNARWQSLKGARPPGQPQAPPAPPATPQQAAFDAQAPTAPPSPPLPGGDQFQGGFQS